MQASILKLTEFYAGNDSTQDMTQAITQVVIEVSKAVGQPVVLTTAEVGAKSRWESVGMESMLGGLTLKQTTFNWNFIDKYTEFKLQIRGK